MSQTNQAASNAKAQYKALCAVCCIFLMNGLMVGSLATHFAAVVSRLSLSQAQFSYALSAMAIGTLMGTSSSSFLIRKIGSRNSILVSGVLAGIGFSVFAAMPLLLWTGISLLFFGLVNGIMDASMNVQAAIIENNIGRPFMTRIHSLYSVGGIIGALIAGKVLDLASPLTHAVGLSIVVVLVCIGLYRFLLPHGEEAMRTGASFAWPSSALWGVASLAFLVLLCAGAMRDWSATYLTQVMHTNYAMASAAFAAFSGAQAFGRFFGDSIRERFGATLLVVSGGLVGGCALIVGLISNNPIIFVMAVGVFGLAHANLTPILFSLAGRSEYGNPALNISAIMTIGLSGYLVGPQIIGHVSDIFGFTIGLSCVVIASLLAAIIPTMFSVMPPNFRNN